MYKKASCRQLEKKRSYAPENTVKHSLRFFARGHSSSSESSADIESSAEAELESTATCTVLHSTHAANAVKSNTTDNLMADVLESFSAATALSSNVIEYLSRAEVLECVERQLNRLTWPKEKQ